MGCNTECLKCGGTGITLQGEPCDCGHMDRVQLPLTCDIPVQYQNNVFCAEKLPEWVPVEARAYMQKLVKDCTKNLHALHKNICLCLPPNSGKTVLAYTVYGTLYAQGQEILKLMDIIEVRGILMDIYNQSLSSVGLLNTSKIAFFKIPMDLPPKFGETVSGIIERRVRNGCSTVFLFSGVKEDLIAQDRFGKFQSLIGDGSYNSLLVKSWERGDK